MSVSVAVFGLAAVAVLWTLAGYPLLLAWRARRGGRTLSPAVGLVDLPTVTAIIPVHNGGRFLEAKLASVLDADYPAERLEIIVLSDGSTDETDAIATAAAAASDRVRFVRLPKGGKAVALTTAFTMTDRDVLLLTDVRQHLDRQCLRHLVNRLGDPQVGVVSGTLKIRSGETAGEASTGLYWRYESWIRTNLSTIDSVLGATGPIYVIRRALARPLPAGCILDDMWLPLQPVLDGYRSVLSAEAVAWDFPTSLSSEFARKVRTQAGLYQLFGLEPRLLNPARNRSFWTFVNLKLLRLLLPHLLLTALVASVFLHPPLRVLALLAQGLFYGAAISDRFVPESSVLKRLTAPIAAFVTLVWAAFCAQAIFFRDPATLWKPTLVRDVAAGQAP